VSFNDLMKLKEDIVRLDHKIMIEWEKDIRKYKCKIYFLNLENEASILRSYLWQRETYFGCV
jgi:hypothetical protein